MGLRCRLRSTLPHELFTPLAGMLGLVEVLRGDCHQMKPQEIAELLEEIDHSGWRLHRTLKNFLFALDLEDEPEIRDTRAPVVPAESVRLSIAGGVEMAINRHKRQPDLVQQIEICDLLAYEQDVAVIAEELVDNACSFSHRGDSIQVRFSSDGTLCVTDVGRGMTAEQIRRIGIIRQFDRKQYEQQGLGLGLLIVQKLATKCGAKLILESQVGVGTTCSVKFTKE